MKFTTFKAGEKEYKLRITGASIVEMEKKMGKNPLNAMLDAVNGVLPMMTDMFTILWGALLPFNANIKYDDICDIYTQYVDGGGTLDDFLKILVKVFEDSGFIKVSEDAPEKN